MVVPAPEAAGGCRIPRLLFISPCMRAGRCAPVPGELGTGVLLQPREPGLPILLPLVRPCLGGVALDPALLLALGVLALVLANP